MGLGLAKDACSWDTVVRGLGTEWRRREGYDGGELRLEVRLQGEGLSLRFLSCFVPRVRK